MHARRRQDAQPQPGGGDDDVEGSRAAFCRAATSPASRPEALDTPGIGGRIRHVAHNNTTNNGLSGSTDAAHVSCATTLGSPFAVHSISGLAAAGGTSGTCAWNLRTDDGKSALL